MIKPFAAGKAFRALKCSSKLALSIIEWFELCFLIFWLDFVVYFYFHCRWASIFCVWVHYDICTLSLVVPIFCAEVVYLVSDSCNIYYLLYFWVEIIIVCNICTGTVYWGQSGSSRMVTCRSGASVTDQPPSTSRIPAATGSVSTLLKWNYK